MKSRSRFISLLLAIIGPILLWSIYKDTDWQELREGFLRSNKKFILLAVLAHLINHALRSYRWKLLLRSQGEKPSFFQAYLAEMSGFCVNAFPLRVGEFVRCKSLQKMHGTPIKRSLAALIVERTAEIFSFFVIFLISLAFFYKQIKEVTGKALGDGLSFNVKIVMAAGLFLVLFLGFFLWHKNYFEKTKHKIRVLFSDFWTALKGSLKANSFSFWGLTALIWLFYFLLEYMCLFAFEETSKVASAGLAPAICIFIALNVSHLSPTGHGMGVYHMLVISVLGNFGVDASTAKFYALITHGIQMFNALVPGGLCFFAVFKIKKKISKVATPAQVLEEA